MAERALVLCPGRGSYAAAELGSLSLDRLPEGRRAAFEETLAAVDADRSERDLPAIREMDGAESFRQEFLRGENAAALILACGAFDLLRLDRERLRPIAVGGNSMGWYTSLYAGGCLDLAATFRLVETMAGALEGRSIGGQLIYPVVGDDWRADERRSEIVSEALETASAAGHRAGRSIHFGGFEVLWADHEGTSFLMEHLPAATLGNRDYPIRLPGNSAFHSPLMEPLSRAGLEELHDLPWGVPDVPMIDGRGAQWRPLHCDPGALHDYTFRTQVLETFDFGATVRVALREYAPERIVLLGPGDTLGAAVGQVLVRERWMGIDSRQAFAERQRDDPLVVSMSRPEQAALVTVLD